MPLTLWMHSTCFWVFLCVCKCVWEHVLCVWMQVYMCWGKRGGQRTSSSVSPRLPPFLWQSLFTSECTRNSQQFFCLLLPLGTHWNHTCACVLLCWGFMWVLGIQTQTIRFAQQVLCPLGHLNNIFLGFLVVKLADSEMHKLYVPCFSDFDRCRQTSVQFDTRFISSPSLTHRAPQSLHLLHSGPSPLPETSTTMLIFTIDGDLPNSHVWSLQYLPKTSKCGCTWRQAFQ